MTEREKLDVNDPLTELNLPVRLHAFIGIVRARLPEMVAPADFDGARRSAAAALLAKAVDLLEDALHCVNAGATDALELVLRTGYEVTLRGRFLLTAAGADEFARMVSDYRTRERQLAADAGTEFVDLPPFLATAAQTDKPLRDLFAVAAALDRHDDLDIEDPASARRWYPHCYRWPSATSAHAGLQSLKRYTSEWAGHLHVVTAGPLRMFSHPEVLFAGLVGALADDVFDDFGIERSHLDALGVRIKPRTV